MCVCVLVHLCGLCEQALTLQQDLGLQLALVHLVERVDVFVILQSTLIHSVRPASASVRPSSCCSDMV